jgi:hypothetical protein
MKLHWILLVLLVSAPLAFAQQAPRVSYSPMRDAPELPEKSKKEMVAWLAEFQNTVFRMNVHKFLSTVNWREIVLQSLPPDAEKLQEEKLERLAKGMELACERMLPQLKTFFLYDRIEIRRIDLQSDVAMIVGRCHDVDDLEFKARWWLRKIDGRWQLVDHENVTVAMRLSTLMSHAMQIQPDAPLQVREISTKFIKIGMATESGDWETALKLTDELLTLKLPGAIRELLLILKADAHHTLDESEKADAALAELEKAGSTNPAFFLMRAGRCQEEGDFEDCIAWSARYGSAIGHDGDSWLMLSDCHRELGHKAEFLRTAEEWLEDYPRSSLAMYTYWQALPEAERAAKVRPLLTALPVAAESFEDFGSAAFVDDDTAALKLLIGVMKEVKMPKEDIEEWESMLEEIMPSEPEKKPGEAGTPKEP